MRSADKVSRIPVKIEPTTITPRKPEWIRAKPQGGAEVQRLKKILREQQLHTVCEEANCPNLGECFTSGTATFMILGDICTRRCPFCDVAHGKPRPVDAEEPARLAKTVAAMGLAYVVITSVDRDDLRDGGAAHFAAVIRALRAHNPKLIIEILTPDFRGREAIAVDILAADPPDVFNHNMETVPDLYRAARPGADYSGSLNLLAMMKARCPNLPTKSGLMLGLGETDAQLLTVLADLRSHKVDMLTLGQYLQPSKNHLPVRRFVSPAQFAELGRTAEGMGFTHVASGPMVRSSYHADQGGHVALAEARA
ncbi:MAG: lipoyl synthase [Halothiobacillus sp. 24-54-40]|nr:lipoyl synthase [Halothiobacillaceae bacterium]OYV45826.1 MAG: lipoyl synthase [Halothiobacillus sp. 20-53-49]OYY41216.1 MAG: lipoyl synthase [Halothiobacillus sp. 35-54-62]OYZ86551.1 MAG: lipoyl synthase [Halothiobacillus sp. 24-54-40]OZA80890.1 MAG: lipoyl synthase [Halothiobacillus sp. 39-53-45]